MAKGNGATRNTVGGNLKAQQLAILLSANPMLDDYHVGIRKEEDILTWEEAVNQARSEGESGGWDELSSYPDVDNEVIERAVKTGKIVVYSSNPIKNGTYVTPSKMPAKDYAGGGQVFSTTINTSDVAWINVDEGEVAIIKKKK